MTSTLSNIPRVFGIRSALSAAVLGAGLLVSSLASANTYNDTTLVSPNKTGSGYTLGNWYDLIGANVFDTSKLDVTNSVVGTDLHATFTYTSNYDGTAAGSRPADVFFDLDGDLVYDLAFVGHKSTTWGNNAVGFYTVTSTYTSADIWGTGGPYGKFYDQPNQVSPNLVDTKLNTGTLLAGALVSSNWTTGNWTFTLNQTLLAGLGIDISAGAILWGTGNCGNDTMYTEYTTPQIVPVPAALWLFGSALAGMGTIGGWRRRAERSAA